MVFVMRGVRQSQDAYNLQRIGNRMQKLRGSISFNRLDIGRPVHRTTAAVLRSETNPA
jgi:hypothetical protein